MSGYGGPFAVLTAALLIADVMILRAVYRKIRARRRYRWRSNLTGPQVHVRFEAIRRAEEKSDEERDSK